MLPLKVLATWLAISQIPSFFTVLHEEIYQFTQFLTINKRNNSLESGIKTIESKPVKYDDPRNKLDSFL